VQWYDPTSLCWFDIQKQPPTAEAARAAYPGGKQCRTMEVTPEGRRPLLNMKTHQLRLDLFPAVSRIPGASRQSPCAAARAQVFRKKLAAARLLVI
jgi:hypothetical protein